VTCSRRRRSCADAARWWSGHGGGALGVTTVIYAPMICQNARADGAGEESARCGGVYSAHMRSEDRFDRAVQETIDIAGLPEHRRDLSLKVAGKRNWNKLMRSSTSGGGARSGDPHHRGHVRGIRRAHGFRWPPCLPGCRRRPGSMDQGQDPAVRPAFGRDARSGAAWENLYGGRGPHVLLASRTRRSSPSRARRWRKWRSSAREPEGAVIVCGAGRFARAVAYFLMSEERAPRGPLRG